MIPLEQELKKFLKDQDINFTDHCNSYKQLDFTLNKFRNERHLHIDAKEKRQKIQVRNWPSMQADNEMHTFIIDDLAVRKIIAYAPYSGMLIRDNLTMNYYWLSVMDIALMPRKRVNRPIEKNKLQHKGKWIVDLRNTLPMKTLTEILNSIDFYCNDVLNISTVHLPCYGNYADEIIPVEGETRKPFHWNNDVKETR